MEDCFGNWQQYLDLSLLKIQGKSCLSRLENAKNGVDIISTVLDERIVDDATWITKYFKTCNSHACCRKSTVNAEQRREEGNKNFQRKKYEDALQLYSESILHAPPGSEQLALGYANRSAVLYRTEHYKECLEDINLALKEGYPQHLWHKVLQRRGQSFVKLGCCQEAFAAFEEAIESLKMWGSPAKKDLQMSDLEKCLSQVKLEENKDRPAVPLSDPVLPSLTYGPGRVLIQTSNAVELKSDPDRGRYLVANKPIKPGDTLIVERPFAAVLLPTHYSTNCFHCFRRLLAPVPCQGCADARYCSLECRDLSWKVYHQFECPYMDLLYSVGVAHLSLRIILTAGLQGLLEFRETYLENVEVDCDSTPGLPMSGTYERNYLAVYELMTHSDDIITEDMFSYALTSTLLLKLLEQTDFFQTNSENYLNCDKHEGNLTSTNLTEEMSSLNVCGVQTFLGTTTKDDNLHVDNSISEQLIRDSNYSISNVTGNSVSKKTFSNTDQRLHDDEKDSSSVRETKLYIGSLLLRHMCQIVCNAHAITELQVSMATDASLVDSKSQVRVATAIYPTASLMNHACDPTIISSFHQDTLIVRAVSHVPPGGQIYNCYGPHCQRMSFSERQQILREQYFFTCSCQACLKDQQNKQYFQALKCPKCEGPLSQPTPLMTCHMCGHVTEGIAQMQAVLTAQSFFVQGIKDLEQGNMKGALKSLEKCLELRRGVMFKHHKELGEINDALARCHATMGNYKKSREYLQESIVITEVIYGSESIELANELHKYTEVLFNCKLFPEALRSADRALHIFILNYGEGHELVRELKEIKSVLMNM